MVGKKKEPVDETDDQLIEDVAAMIVAGRAFMRAGKHVFAKLRANKIALALLFLLFGSHAGEEGLINRVRSIVEHYASEFVGPLNTSSCINPDTYGSVLTSILTEGAERQQACKQALELCEGEDQ